MLTFLRTLAGIGCLLLVAFCAKAQPLAAYTNLQNQVMVWDNGILRKVDYLPPLEVRVGRSAIPYIDNARNFRVYYGGGSRTINPGYTNTFRATDNIAVFLNQRSLNVFDRGQVTNLALLATDYYFGDSIVLWRDGVQQDYKAYYNGEIYPVENFLAAQGLELVKVSDNIAAYDNYANQFHLFYRGDIIAQEDYAVSSFDVGRNTVAYVDANRMFKIFHEGTTIATDNFAPEDYAVGDNLVAWNSFDGYFKVFYQDSVYSLGYFKAEYKLADNVVAFRDNTGWLRAFYKGQVYNLDNFWPNTLQVHYHSLAYINRAGMLRLFTEGEVYDVTNAQVDAWELNYDVIKYRIGANLFRIFYKGTEY